MRELLVNRASGVVHEVHGFQMPVHLNQLVECVHILLGFSKHRDLTALLIYGRRLPSCFELFHYLNFLVYVPSDFVLHLLRRQRLHATLLLGFSAS